MRTIENLDANIPAEADKDHERECVEQVFGLTGGELSDRSWEPWIPSEMTDPTPFDFEYASEGSKRRTFLYWFDGLPDYLGRCGFPDLYDASYRTVVDCEVFGESPAVVYEAGVAWHRVATYQSGGECECPGQHEDDGSIVTSEQRLTPSGLCVLCEEKIGEEHGHIYIGDGWAEVVYRSVDLPAPLSDGFDVGTVVWWKDRPDNYTHRLIVAAGPAPEDFEGMFVAVYVDDDGTDDESYYINADAHEEVKTSP